MDNMNPLNPILLSTLLFFASLINVSAKPECCSGSNDFKTSNWETIDCNGEPIARHEAAFIEFEGKFYLLGGRRIEPVSVYDPTNSTWEQASKPPVEFHHFQPVVYQDRILIVCAMTGKYPNETGLEKVLEYYPGTDTWKWGHDIPKTRQRGSAGVVNIENTIYVACGIVRGHMGGFINWMDKYDPETGTWETLADAPQNRDHFQCAYYDGKIYAAGGRTTSKETNQVFDLTVADVDVYDIASNTWSQLPKPLPTPRAGNSTLAVGSDIVVAGGESAQKTAHDEVEAWNTLKEKWIDYPSLNRGRHGTALLLHQNYIYTCSGSGNQGGGPELTSTERLALPLIAEERDGFVEVEAEHFVSQTHTGYRQWYTMSENSPSISLRDDDENHSTTASGNAYIELLPDTRTNHDEELITGENFMNDPGKMAVISYPIKFNTPGFYWVWCSAFSTGTEDNGLHVGVNGKWPKSGQRIQWCEGKDQWTWSSAQRVDQNHCGFPRTIRIKIDEPGVHNIHFSMREDGVEFDRFILVNDPNFSPEGYQPPETLKPFSTVKPDEAAGEKLLAFETIAVQGEIPYYIDINNNCYGVNAGNPNFREGFAVAETHFKDSSGNYDLTLNTLGEIDGESSYRISVNGVVIGMAQNPETDTDYSVQKFSFENIAIRTGDTIRVESCAHTNGKIPEGDATAWSRGRWISLIYQPEK